jgi:hypothetical protein
MRRPLWVIGSVVAGLALLLALAPDSRAQEIPDEFSNLRILPESIAKEELKGIMTGFTEQLGVKCTHCHVLGEYHKDENEHKLVARQMIRLVQHMRENTELYFKEGTELNQIGCWTCHRGEAEIDGFFPEEEDEDWP